MCCSCGNKRGTSEPKSSSVNSLRVGAQNDLAGSFLVKILHSVEGGDVEQGCPNLEINIPYLRLLSLYLSLVFTYFACLHCFIFICLIYLVLNCYMFGIACSHLYSTKRVIVAPQLLI